MFNKLHFAYGMPKSRGQIKTAPLDFCVEENLGFELTGTGEHLFLNIEKTQLNTEEMANILAQKVGLPLKAISYAGMKDKFARTTQWFSLHLPGMPDPELAWLDTENYRLLKSSRHNKKLKIGALKENHFIIKVCNFDHDEKDLLLRIEQIKAHGVPNYFGLQRFGHNGNNLQRARAILLENKKTRDRHLRGIYYSAARSFLFNEILSHRVGHGHWNRPLDGDLMMLVGSHSVFPVDSIDEGILQRIKDHDISPTAPLWGKGNDLLRDKALAIQKEALEGLEDWCLALERHKLERSYRPLILFPEKLVYKDGVFTFTLPAGGYATMVLRELLVPMDPRGEAGGG